MEKIRDKEHLDELLIAQSNEEFNGLECAISSGILKSSKTIYRYAKNETYEIYHEIDGEYETFKSLKDLLETTNIGTALDNGALWMY